jgi:outer membrane protein assembly factor BamA
VEFIGNKSIPIQQLQEALELKLNVPLALSDLEEKSQKLISYYLDQGYLQMRLLNFGPQMIQYSSDYAKAKLKFEIEEGPQIRVRSIELEGNNITRDFVILNELEFKPGDILTRAKVKDTKDRLYLTGLFRDIEILIDPEESTDPNRVVKIKVFEREPGLFNAGFGAHNERGLTLRGFAGASYNNLLGTARALSARIEGQYNLVTIPFFERSIQAFYLEPYLLDTRIRGRIGVSRSFLITDFNNSIASEANRTNYTLEHNITPKLLARWRIYEITTFRDFSIRSNADTNNVNIGSSLISLEWDHRDHPFNPKSGFLTGGLFEYAHPNLLSSDWVQFYKTQVNWTQYQSLFGSNWVLAVSGRLGQIWNETHQNYAIPYDKVGFFLGGQVNLRGFTLNEIFPNTLDLGGNNYRLKGSAQMQLIKTELRIPIWESIGTALFYDMGNIRFSDNLYDSSWRQSAGIAFRYNTPVGAVSLEYAWKLPPKASRQESPATLHFAIGTF